MDFDPNVYGPQVASLLALDGDGRKLMPLTMGEQAPEDVQQSLRQLSAGTLFPRARASDAALSGLWLYFGCFDESHGISQDVATAEGSFWHAILHRREPDAGNAGYWFRRVGKHPIFPRLRDEVEELGAYSVGDKWDPLQFIEFCERARRHPGSKEEGTAKRVQLIEWQLLFDYCAAPL